MLSSDHSSCGALLLERLRSHAPIDDGDAQAVLDLPFSTRSLEPTAYLVREGEPPQLDRGGGAARAAAAIRGNTSEGRAMPRFYFNTTDGGVHRDEEGTDLPSTAAARVEAVRYGGSLLADDPDLLWDGRELRVEVTDESGGVVATVIMLAIDGGGRRREA